MDYLASTAVFAAFTVKGICGFANTLVFSSIMGFSASNLKITPVELLTGYPSNIFIAWKERKNISPSICIPLSLYVIAGSIPGALILKNADLHFIKAVFGTVIIIIAIETLLRAKSGKNRKPSGILMALTGLVSGILCGLFGIGALLAAYVGRTAADQKQFRANICVVFFIENTFRIVLYSFTGILTAETVLSASKLLPFMAAGLAVGAFAAKFISETLFKKTVILLLVISGISIVLKNLIY